MCGKHDGYLSRRLQQIMDLAYQKGSILATDVEQLLDHSPSNSTVRTQLRTLEERGLLTHREEYGRFVYSPTRPRTSAAKEAMRSFLKTFVDGSAALALSTLLSAKEAELTEGELAELEETIRQARERNQNKGGRK